jgi:hypothetical protein
MITSSFDLLSLSFVIRVPFPQFQAKEKRPGCFALSVDALS